MQLTQHYNKVTAGPFRDPSTPSTWATQEKSVHSGMEVFALGQTVSRWLKKEIVGLNKAEKMLLLKFITDALEFNEVESGSMSS